MQSELQVTKDQKAKLFFYTITIAAFPGFLILLALMLINPFWFRQDMIQWLIRLSKRFATYRCETVEDIRRGYVLTIGD
jgi:hypothetical protein